jgi:ketosteroid isomerase-like protein
MHPTIARLAEAMSRHDVAAMTALMAPDYRSEQPAHPNRGFGGADQVAANWSAMLAGVPDMQVECLAETTDGGTSWSEWSWRGTHTDGTPFAMRGVVLFDMGDDGLIHAARLYVEPVEEGGAAIDAAVEELARPPR